MVGAVQPASLAATPALGGRKTAVIVFNFADDTRQPWTPRGGPPAGLHQRGFHQRLLPRGKPRSALAHREDGQPRRRRLRLLHDRRRRQQVQLHNWASQARAAAAADGFAASGYQHVMYVFPEQELLVGRPRAPAGHRVVDQRRADRARDRPRARAQHGPQSRWQLELHERRHAGDAVPELHGQRVQRPVRQHGELRRPSQPRLAPRAARRARARERPDHHRVGQLLDDLGAGADRLRPRPCASRARATARATWSTGTTWRYARAAACSTTSRSRIRCSPA